MLSGGVAGFMPSAPASAQQKINYQQTRTGFSQQIYLPGNETSVQLPPTLVMFI